MKTNILKSTIAVLLSAVTLAAADEPLIKPKEDNTQSHSSSSTTVNSKGEVTIEIDVNGNKQRKTFKLGDNEPFTWKVEDGDAKAEAKVGGKAKIGNFLKAGRDALAKHEKVTWLGVAAEPVGDDLRAQLPLAPGEGLTVRHVMPESPAAVAGVQEYDILTRVDDQILLSPEQLRSLVKMHKAGDTVKLTYLRKGEKKEATATLAEHEAEREELGLLLRGAKDQLQSLNLDNDVLASKLSKGADNIRELQEHLRELKEKIPGIIVDKKSFLVGPDGIVQKFANEKADEIVDKVRKELEKAKITPEEREELRKSVEDAVHSAREAAAKAEELLKRAKDKTREDKPDEDKKP